MKLTPKQEEVMAALSHLLVTGGPGSGKTTVSILKAGQIIEKELRHGQKVLFLSFARATVSRVIEAIEHEQNIPKDHKKRIDVETYHSFFWRVLKAHGYLVGLPRILSILPPPNEAIALSNIRSLYPSGKKITQAQKLEKSQKENAEKERLAIEEGKICFDLFAHFVGQVLHRSDRIKNLLATMYPIIIFDEFQDTNKDQWHIVQALGKYSRLIALADPEQRIYDWIGADPKRLEHFKDKFNSKVVDLSTDNHRSKGTEIAVFGNDILKGKFRKDTYDGVECCLYEPNPNQAWTSLVTSVLQSRKRLTKNGIRKWSLAVLVPTKKMTRLVSDKLRDPPAGLALVNHTAAVEMEAAILGAEMIAFLLQSGSNKEHLDKFVDLLCEYYQGKGGDSPTKGDLEEASKIRKAYTEYLIRKASKKPIRANSILVAILDVYEKTRSAKLTGNPDKDWRLIRDILETGSCNRLKDVAQEVRNIRLLDRGTQLRQALSENWRETGAYSNALEITQLAFVQEHFSTSHRPEQGVVVMNMHKAKGKQFDEVIIFEGWPKIVRGEIVANTDRIVRSNLPENDNDQARQNFRVSITRGKRRVTILTPKGNPCILLFNRS